MTAFVSLYAGATSYSVSSVMGDSGSLQGEGEAQRIGGVEGELFSWFRVQGVSEEGSRKAIALLDSRYLEEEPRPRRWNQKAEFGHQERCRYLWYRHAARILGWTERTQFPDFVRELLRSEYYPSSVVVGHEEARESSHVREVGGEPTFGLRRGDGHDDHGPRGK